VSETLRSPAWRPERLAFQAATSIVAPEAGQQLEVALQLAPDARVAHSQLRLELPQLPEEPRPFEPGPGVLEREPDLQPDFPRTRMPPES